MLQQGNKEILGAGLYKSPFLCYGDVKVTN